MMPPTYAHVHVPVPALAEDLEPEGQDYEHQWNLAIGPVELDTPDVPMMPIFSWGPDIEPQSHPNWPIRD